MISGFLDVTNPSVRVSGNRNRNYHETLMKYFDIMLRELEKLSQFFLVNSTRSRRYRQERAVHVLSNPESLSRESILPE